MSRDDISYQGNGRRLIPAMIDGVTITHDRTKTGGSAQVGLAVMLSGNSTIALTNDGSAVVGKLYSVEEDGVATVEVGFVELPGGAGATLTVGTPIVGDLGASNVRGYVRSADSAVAAELLKARGLIFDATTPAETVVCL